MKTNKNEIVEKEFVIHPVKGYSTVENKKLNKSCSSINKVNEKIEKIWLKVLQNEKDLQDLKNKFNSLICDGK